MSVGILLDTHVWLWFSQKNEAIKPKIQKLIDKAIVDSELFLSAISVWELAMLEVSGRVSLSLPCSEWVEGSLRQLNIQLLPLSPNIMIESCHLPNSFHGDPADRMIVATARIYNLQLLTKDQKIIDYAENHLVKVIAL